MALIEVIKYNGNNSEFVWKFPAEDLKLGAQLIVNSSQRAFFVKDGQVLDGFNEGRFTLKSANVPVLNKLVNLPFGGKSPFAAEVWYVNLIAKLDNKWGTVKPIHLEDPLYRVIVPVRAFGQFGFRIRDAKTFLQLIVGTIKVFTAREIIEYFKGKIISSITMVLSRKVVLDSVSLLQIGVFQEDLSRSCQEDISKEFSKHGIELLNFNFISINIPEDDTSFIKLKEAKEFAMKINTVSRDMYQVDRSFDVMEGFSGNEGNFGSILNAGLGLGAGLNLGHSLGTHFGQVGQHMNISQPPPIPEPPKLLYYFVIGGKQSQAYSINEIQGLVDQGVIGMETLAWKQGLCKWSSVAEFEELHPLFNQMPPPIL